MRKLSYPDGSNITPMVQEFRDSAGISGDYHIVAKKRGDCVVGYKIRQDGGYGTRPGSSRYRGVMVYTLEAARELREFYRRNDGTAHTSFEVIE